MQEVEDRGEENLSSLDKILSDPENFPTTEEIIREMPTTEKKPQFSPVKYMLVAWILNFQVNLRKIISLENPIWNLLESQVNEVFSIRICTFYMPKLHAAAAIAE